jgi:cob(I)alamin adenosyltransferase
MFYSGPVSIVINRVYTKAGDRGRSRLTGGQEIDKDDTRLEAYGTVDELNAVLGGVLTLSDWTHCGVLEKRLLRIQHELFDLGGELATLEEDRHPQQVIISIEDITRLENEMDEVNKNLPTLKSFVLPGGGNCSALMHQARTVCRRAERRVVTLNTNSLQRPELIQYLNRLSDWLFVMGRHAAVQGGHEELLWQPGMRGID